VRLDIRPSADYSMAGGVTANLGRGDGAFQAVQYFPIVPTALGLGAVPVSIALGNLNGDGALDAVVSIEARQTINVLLGSPRTPVDAQSVPPSRRGLSVAVYSSAGAFRIEYQLPTSATVRLTLHDVRGRLLRVLDQGLRGAGAHEVAWDPSRERGALARGVYFVQLRDGQGRASSKLVLRHR
jgi:hypothetical protein